MRDRSVSLFGKHAGECELCGNTTFWRHRRPGSPWICVVRVPPELEPHEVEWAEEVRT